MILCLEAHERGIYEVLAPLYFPRDILEESSALWQLPRDIGGTFGEPQIVERQIRIIHNPQHSVMINGECWWLGGRIPIADKLVLAKRVTIMKEEYEKIF